MRLRHLFACIGFLAAAVPAVSPAAAGNTVNAWASWKAELLRNHPLVGKIWSVKAGAFISKAEMATALRQARFVLLGEIHDNPDHHRLQAWAIRTVGEDKRKPVVVMEMLNDAQAPAIKRFFDDSEQCCRIVIARDLFKAVNWNKSGWPSATIYQPIVEAALSVHARMWPGSVTRQKVRAVAKSGIAQLSEGRRKRLGLAEPLAAPLAEALRKQLKDSHCGMLPDRALPSMMRAQRFRDAVMADRLVLADRHAVLIAGNGHVRKDRGVPLVLRRLAPGNTIITVTQAEVEQGRPRPQDYVPVSPSKTSATDYVWFTPRTKRADPCAEMRRHMMAKPKTK